MSVKIVTAMLMAAGLGKRMRPLTATRPKPLVKVAGKALMDHALDRLEAGGIERVIVNVHYLADTVEAHVKTRKGPMQIVLSDERAALLETGGGVKKALPLLGTEPFFHVNSDSLWSERGTSNVAAMARAWDPAAMDMLMLLARREDSVGFDGRGDFFMDEAGRLVRRGAADSAPFVYAGVIVMPPALFADAPEGSFSLNLLFDGAIARGRLFGLVLAGRWLHVGTPEAIAPAEAAFAAAQDRDG